MLTVNSKNIKDIYISEGVVSKRAYIAIAAGGSTAQLKYYYGGPYPSYDSQKEFEYYDVFPPANDDADVFLTRTDNQVTAGTSSSIPYVKSLYVNVSSYYGH